MPHEFTPGPWRLQTALSSDWRNIRYLNGPDCQCIADIRSGSKSNDPPEFGQMEALANARLIAAAPAMAAALQAAESALLEGLENCGNDPDSIWADPLATVRAALQAAGLQESGK